MNLVGLSHRPVDLFRRAPAHATDLVTARADAGRGLSFAAGSALASRLALRWIACDRNEGCWVAEPKNLEIRIRTDQVRLDPIAVGDVHIMTQIIELKFVYLHLLLFRISANSEISFSFI